MEFRADAITIHGQPVIRLAGRLHHDHVAEVVSLCGENPEHMRIDLKDLISSDFEGIEVLRKLRAKGAELYGASPFIAHRLGPGS